MSRTPAEPYESIRFGHPRISWLELTAVGAGGAVGALARVGLAQAWPSAAGGWPWATLVVNIAGAFMLGCLMIGLRHGPVSIPAYRLLGTGFCGALTTFSAMQLELLEMLDRAHYGLAAGYLSASVAGGYAAVVIAERLIRRTTTWQTPTVGQTRTPAGHTPTTAGHTPTTAEHTPTTAGQTRRPAEDTRATAALAGTDLSADPTPVATEMTDVVDQASDIAEAQA